MAGLFEHDRLPLVVDIDPATRPDAGDSAEAFDAYLSALAYVGRPWPHARGASVAGAAADEPIIGKAGYFDAPYKAAPKPCPIRFE